MSHSYFDPMSHRSLAISTAKLTKSFENVKKKVRARQEIKKQGVATVVLAGKHSPEPAGFSV